LDRSGSVRHKQREGDRQLNFSGAFLCASGRLAIDPDLLCATRRHAGGDRPEVEIRPTVIHRPLISIPSRRKRFAAVRSVTTKFAFETG
jgi:hypothetical protein